MEEEDRAARLRVAAHPLVVASLVVLVVNDRALKGWSADQGVVARTVTGKASDVAGVLLLAVIIGILSGRRRPTVIGVGLAFTALKLSPVIADLAIPVLGGRTRTDPWDLLALAALVPADHLLRRLDDRLPPDLRPVLATPLAGSSAPWASLRATLGLAVVVLSVPAMTATAACPDSSTVALLAADDDGLLAAVGDGTHILQSRREAQEGILEQTVDPPNLSWFRSTDGGSTWTPVTLTAARVRDVAAPEPPKEECLGDTCYRVDLDDREVEQRVGDGRWERSFAHTGRVVQGPRMPMSCPKEEKLFFQHLATDDGAIVVGNGTQGVVRREGSGDWERIPLGHLQPVDLHPAPPFGTTLGVGLGLFLLGAWLPLLSMSHRPPRRALSAGGICWGGALALASLCALTLWVPFVAEALSWPVVLLLGLGIAAAAVIITVRSRPPRPVRAEVGPRGPSSSAGRPDDPPSPWTD